MALVTGGVQTNKAFATEYGNAENITVGVLPPSDEDVAEAEAELSAKDKMNLELELSGIDEKINARLARSGSSWTYLYGYEINPQERKYYCVPACIQSMLKYINEKEVSQDTIASGCNTVLDGGTKLSNALSYLNSHQSGTEYAVKYQGKSSAKHTAETIARNLYYDIVLYDVPALLAVDADEIYGWQYNTDAHAVCVYGAESSRENFAVADPCANSGFESKALETYTNQSIESIYSGCTNKTWCGYIY